MRNEFIYLRVYGTPQLLQSPLISLFNQLDGVHWGKGYLRRYLFGRVGEKEVMLGPEESLFREANVLVD